MFGIADYGAFVVAFIILLFIPGPGNLAIITSTTKGGLKGGLAATLGLMAGDQVLMWLAVGGWRLCWPPIRRPFVPCNGWGPATWLGWVSGC